jgi:predicted 2-oxoglutarate/Fe(II)-dependent dioxygenase YbiX
LLEAGDMAPWFQAASPTNPTYHFNSVGGRYILLGFLPVEDDARRRAMAGFLRLRQRFDDRQLAAFIVIHDAPSIAVARDQKPGLRWFFDPDRAIAGQYGIHDGLEDPPVWLLLDPALRVMATARLAESDALFEKIAQLPSVSDYAGVTLQAPVLILPRVFEPEVCRRLIDTYEAAGGEPSGVMRDVAGRTVGVLDDFKRRRDVFINDEPFRQELVARVARRLIPEIQRVFQFNATRIERYVVACYDSAEGGYFRPHRDNLSFATAHRRFAVSINLNAEEFEGGDLRFPEFGQRTYRPPTGGAVVFACGMLHEATPVTAGRRYAFLPFLYDRAGEQIREAYQAKIAAETI